MANELNSQSIHDPVIRFDLDGDYERQYVCTNCDFTSFEFVAEHCGGQTKVVFGRKGIFGNPAQFWSEMGNTAEILVPKRTIDWLIGQDMAYKRLTMALEEWLRKVKDMTYMRKEGVELREILKSRPGPYILLIGAPGVGKSLLIKAMAEDLERIYKEHGVELYDVLAVKNPMNQYEPHIVTVAAGMGKRVVTYAVTHGAKTRKVKGGIILGLCIFMMLMGLAIIGFTFYRMSGDVPSYLALCYQTNQQVPGSCRYSTFQIIGESYLGNAQLLALGAIILVFPLLILMWRGQFNRGKTVDEVPNLLVDNDPATVRYYEDVTITTRGRMFGAVEWSPWGEAQGLAKPTHHRLVAGAIHKANMKLLFFDEFKNLAVEQADELLQILEDGQAPIRDKGGTGSGTASQNVQSPPIDATFLLIAAGNEDIVSDPFSILNLRPALKDRFRYGSIIIMQDEMDATPENEIKVAQVVAQECLRFRFPPVTREGVRVIVDFMRGRASNNDKMRIQFRAVIEILKAAAQLTWMEKKVVIGPAQIDEAITTYAKGVVAQMMAMQMEKTAPHKLLPIEGPQIGMVNGLAVYGETDYGEEVGDAFKVTAFMFPVDDVKRASFVVTGVNPEEGSWMQDSIAVVKSAIAVLYPGVNLEKDYYTHISFNQTKGVDGPSAGAAMTVAVMSYLGDPRKPPKDRKPVPMRQDVAMTGAVEMIMENGVPRTSAVGGIYGKVHAAAKYNIVAVVMPETNFEKNVTEEMKKKITIIPARTVLDYFDAVKAVP